MIERVINNPDFVPRAVWTVIIRPSCPNCANDMLVTSPDPARFALKCVACDYSCPMDKSPDDIADDVIEHVKSDKPIDKDRLLKLAKQETEVQKQEAKEKGEE